MRILLADDHLLFAEGLRNLLVSQGFDVVGIARDGFEAVEQAKRTRPDVIPMDIIMPRCSGLAATRLIKAEIPDIRIVMLTMSEDDGDLFESVKSGASGYLLKNLHADELAEMLKDLARGDPPFSPGLAAKLLEEFTHLAGKAAIGGPGHEAASRSQPRSAAEEVVAARGAPAAAGASGDDCTADSAGEWLTPRQVEVLTLVASGMTYKEVGRSLFISERTVKYHMKQILGQLHLRNRAQVIAYAAKANLTASPDAG